jgi:hypothetical protein
MKTLTIDEAKELLRKITSVASERNLERAKHNLHLLRYRICPKCREVTEQSYCSCKETIH